MIPGKQALPHHSALLINDSIAVNHNVTDSASDQQLQGAMPEDTDDLADSMQLQDSISSAIHDLLNSTEETAASDSASREQHAEQPKGSSSAFDHLAHDSIDTHAPYQSNADDLVSAVQPTSAPRQSVPQDGAASSDNADLVAGQGSHKSFVTQQQMDESGHAHAFAKIMESIPDHVKNMVSEGHVPSNTEALSHVNQSASDGAESVSPGSSHTQHHEHAEL